MNRPDIEPWMEARASTTGDRLEVERSNNHSVRVFLRDSQGTVLLSDKLEAGVGHFGFSGDGDLAWLITFGFIPEEPDAHKVIVYSVKPPVELFRIDAPERAEYVELVPGAIEICDHWGTRYRVSMNGTIMNAEAAKVQRQEKWIEQGPAWRLQEIMEQRYQEKPITTWTGAERAETLRMIERILVEKNEPIPVSRCERIRGEILLANGDKQKALEHLRRALKVNPRVGVKKIISQLDT